ncbi:MAG TPA: ABC transporter permease subunit [Thermoanaerobaculia bacterium]|nr:ABC transporter permease subunit [Thermoanaerobaculia bacterium]
MHPQTARKRLIADRAARWVVSAGGLAIIVSILGILVFILAEVWPLMSKARVRTVREIPLPGPPAGALVSDEHRTYVAALAADGHVRMVRLKDGKLAGDVDLGTGPLTGMKVPAGQIVLTGATRDGRVVLAPVSFEVTFEGQTQVITPAVKDPILLELDPQRRPLGAFAAQVDEEGGATSAAQLADGTIAVVRRSSQENTMTGEMTESVQRFEAQAPGRLTALVIDDGQTSLYGGTARGEILWWPLAEGQPGRVRAASAGPSSITALDLLIGGRSLVVGQKNGALSIWLQTRESQGGDVFRLTRVRDFPRSATAIRQIAPSERGKGFLAMGDGGKLGLYYSTSHRTLWTGDAPIKRGAGLFYTPKTDGVYLAGEGKLAELDVFNPHPEVTWKTLFGKVWYEGYDEPAHVWQSSSGSDDFEPKLSLTPLLAGTLKGTFYSLLLAIPLGVLGAMYTSQFMHPSYKRVLKPMVEIMASLPSVVLGFLAGLWLAPRIEEAMPALILMPVILPVLILAAGLLWNRSTSRAFRTGTEAILFVFVLAFGMWLCFQLSGPFEKLAFGGSFQGWLGQSTGLHYDQRNAIVVGLAMGFAVIPIIFAIAEDAFSNVPANLVAGSLALGADRWQTVTRVVLPTASPGIFSAIMIGFGRAVGETMIVLMATGNTPIMDWNPFNGFRTLSANIAVEIPEAPHGSTLYRTLFLAGLLLFVVTFVINTVAELVRQRLRERYSQL